MIQLEHPYITKFLGYCTDHTCYLLELMPYGSLFRLLQQGPLPLAIANGILFHLVEAVTYLHGKGVTHGDIKLDNLLISFDFKVKLCDFGFAKINGTTPLPKK